MSRRCHLMMIVALFGALLIPALAEASPAWMTRPGTTEHAIGQVDGTRVYLDAVNILKIRARQTPYYIVVSDWGIKNRIVVLTTPASVLRPGQTVDIEGVVTTLSNGERAIAKARVIGYQDRNGNLLLHGPLIKGTTGPTPWQWKADLTVRDISTATAPDEAPTPPGEPSSSLASAPTFCATIADAKAQADGTAVELRCRPVSSTGSGYFMLGEDASSDTLKTYYTAAVTTSYRVVTVTGTIQTEGTDKVLDIDSGPGYDPQVFTGSVSLALSGTIAWAKTFADWTELPTDGRTYALEKKPVSWCDGSRVYIEEADRSSGILLNNASLPPNDSPYVASVTGVINTNGDGERSIDVYSISYTATTSAPRPLGMNNRSTATGLKPNGLLLRAWGKVAAVNPTEGYLYIDDGSALKDGTLTDTQENVGVRVQYNDTYFPSVGNFAVVTGPLGTTYDYGTSTSVNCLRTRGGLDTALSPPSAPTGLEAVGGNGVVTLTWDSMNAASYSVYRSTSETGTYTVVGSPTTNAYSDGTVTNGTTYWYKVAAVNNDEGPQSTAVSATPSSLAPTVAITNAVVDADGLLTLQCTGSSSYAGYTLRVDGDDVWTFSQSEIGSIVYDTTQLPNGAHTFSIQASEGTYQGVASTALNIQNFISEFNVPDDMCGLQAISAKFQESTSWTLTISQSGTTIYSTSGSGTSMEASWDAGSTYGEFDITLAANGRSRTAKSRKTTGSGGSYYAWGSIYVADKDSTMENTFRYMHQYASAALQAKYGVSLYSGKLSNDSDWQDVVIDTILNGDIPANNLAIAAHGVAGVKNPKKPLWQGIVLGQFPSSSYAVGSGLTAFVNINSALRGGGDFIPVGPAIGNTLNWDQATGRVSNWNCTRRLRFVYISACRAGQGVFSLVFGTPRGRYPGRGRAFLSFKNEVPAGYAMMFSEKFWAEWQRGGVTVAEAATRAFWRVLDQKKYRTDYVLHGDPNLVIK